jgi:hypothetical protein
MGSAEEMVTVDPADLQAAQEQDAAMPDAELATARNLENLERTQLNARYFARQVWRSHRQTFPQV